MFTACLEYRFHPLLLTKVSIYTQISPNIHKYLYINMYIDRNIHIYKHLWLIYVYVPINIY